MKRRLIVLILTTCAVPVSFARYYTVDRVEAAVNSEIILKSDVEDFRRNQKLRLQLDPLFADSPLSRKSPSDQEISAFLIDERMIMAVFPTTDDEVEQEVRSIETKNKITRSTLQAALLQQGFAFSDYFKLIRMSLSKRKLIDRDIRTKVFISDDDVKNEFLNTRSQTGKKTYNYVLKAIQTPQIDEARAAADELRLGHAFEEVAKKHSHSPTATTGADLGTFSEADMSPMIRDEVKKMKVGTVSGIIGNAETQFMIIKLTDIKTGVDQEMERQKEEIRNVLAAKEFRRQIELWVERKRHDAFVHVPKYD